MAWLRMMTEWVGPLKAKPVNEVRTEDVLAALKPYWKSRPETARRMRMRIEAVLDAAKAKGLIADPWANPARWKGHLQHLLEKPAVAVRHHPALPYAEHRPSWPPAPAGEHGRQRAGLHDPDRGADLGDDLRDLGGNGSGREGLDRARRADEGRAGSTGSRCPTRPWPCWRPSRTQRRTKPTSWVFPSLFKKGRRSRTAAMDRACWTTWACGEGRPCTACGRRSGIGPATPPTSNGRRSRRRWRMRSGMRRNAAYQAGRCAVEAAQADGGVGGVSGGAGGERAGDGQAGLRNHGIAAGRPHFLRRLFRNQHPAFPPSPRRIGEGCFCGGPASSEARFFRLPARHRVGMIRSLGRQRLLHFLYPAGGFCEEGGERRVADAALKYSAGRPQSFNDPPCGV
jgi:hypothetical protein